MYLFYTHGLAVEKTKELSMDRSLASVKYICWRKRRQVKLPTIVEICSRCVKYSNYSTKS